MLNEAVGSLYDELGGAIVLFQFEQASPSVCLLEIQDVIDVCPTKAVDALSIVTHHTHTLPFLGQLHDNGLLGIVRILVLINEHVGKTLSILSADVLMFTKQHEGLHQQVIEVHGVRLSATLSIAQVDILDGRHLTKGIIGSRRAVGIGLSQQQVVLGHRYTVGHTCCLVLLVVKLHLTNDGLY